MLNLTVRNVGQGDCIVLRWKNDEGRDELGIIDCNEHDMSSLLTEISEVKFIKFILLTHPHSDHYSGLFRLLDYCYQPDRSITVEKIYHTAAFKPEFLIGAINYPHEREKFRNLLLFFDNIHTSAENKTTCEMMVAGVAIELSSELKIHCLAPSLYYEIKKYTATLFERTEENQVRFKPKRANNPNGNYLSTILLIHNPKWEILLTSDAVYTTFERLIKSDIPFKKSERKIVLGQVPHHGSLQNHAPEFWRVLINKEESRTFISSGMNQNYRHPHMEVVKFFDENSILEYTNYVHGFEDYLPRVKDSSAVSGSEILDFISERVDMPLLPSKDIRFSIDSAGEIQNL